MPHVHNNMIVEAETTKCASNCYDHANGTDCHVGSLEEEAHRTARRISPKEPMYEATNGSPERRSFLTLQQQHIVYL
jgi:hypothetical protein